MAFGKANYNKGGTKFTKTPAYSPKFEDFKPTDNIFRILPAMHSLAEDGKWFVFKKLHWGYKRSTTDKSKTYPFTFVCIEDFDQKTKTVVSPCPECDLISKYQDTKKLKEAKYLEEGKTEDEIDTLLTPIKKWLKDHNCERKVWYGAVTEKGEPCHLKLSYTTKKKLDAKIEDLMATEGIDATDLDTGVWFNFRRIDNKGTDEVEVVTTLVEVTMPDGKKKKLPETKMAPLSEAQAADCLEKIADLAKNNSVTLNFEQIQLLTTSSGDPDEVDRIIGMTQRNERSNPKERSAPLTPNSPAPTRTAPLPNPIPVTPPASAGLNLEDPMIKARIELIEKKRAEAKAQEEAAVQAAAVAAKEAELKSKISPPKDEMKVDESAAKAAYDMPEDEFMKMVAEQCNGNT